MVLELEARFLRRVLELKPRVLIANCTPIQPTNDQLVAEIAATGTHVIHVEPYKSDGMPNGNYLIPDYYQGGRAMAVALMISGYQHPLFAYWPNYHSPFHDLSKAGFIAALAEQGRGGKEEVEFSVEQRNGNVINLKKLRSPQFLEGFFASSENSLGVACPYKDVLENLWAAARVAGINPPSGLGLVGMNFANCDFSDSEIGHVRFERQDIFKRAIYLGLDKKAPLIRELVQPSLIKGSTLN